MSDAKSVLITGATSGIGRAAALGFAKAGYRVALCGRRRDRLEQVASDIPGCYAHPVDVTDPHEVARLFKGARDAFGRIDVVFNNAGQSGPAIGFGDLDLETWKRIVDTNLNGAFYVAREAFRAMRDQAPQGGRIINNGSISSHVPRPGAAPYAASKHGVTGLTRAISLDGRAYNIACSQIDIGNVASDMTASMATGMLQANGSVMPEPTFSVEHVVNALLYMAGLPPEANVQFITVMATTMPYIGRG
jgi:NAD(P)-dependent dehydrogenase (short-subunit alcohol dehydrogenase family)